ncbi:hypothetical protein Ssi02_69650 [Sinosporangium siamense]|uniref:Uncharacterized protein n=1 Tax=Sinosporangium siamense TaxID=1367973 RepID=A0A919RQC9_9ACTN|nr:hypothetical protein Ssi02_69650 [Sinosporangium siamense]
MRTAVLFDLVGDVDLRERSDLIEGEERGKKNVDSALVHGRTHLSEGYWPPNGKSSRTDESPFRTIRTISESTLAFNQPDPAKLIWIYAAERITSKYEQIA